MDLADCARKMAAKIPVVTLLIDGVLTWRALGREKAITKVRAVSTCIGAFHGIRVVSTPICVSSRMEEEVINAHCNRSLL